MPCANYNYSSPKPTMPCEDFKLLPMRFHILTDVQLQHTEYLELLPHLFAQLIHKPQDLTCRVLLVESSLVPQHPT